MRSAGQPAGRGVAGRTLALSGERSPNVLPPACFRRDNDGLARRGVGASARGMTEPELAQRASVRPKPAQTGIWSWPQLARLGLVCVALSGCKLIDQTTFAPAPEAKPPAQAQPAAPLRVDPRTPLAVIDFSTPEPEYHGPLSYAVRAAQARDRGVEFDVVGVTRSADDASIAQSHAVDVMRTMMTERVPASQLHLGLQTDPATPANEVRVYVR